MLLSGISLGSSIFQALDGSGSRKQGILTEFKQLGQDLQAGNLTKAQSDYTALRRDVPNSLQSATSTSPLAQDFTALGQALQSGSLPAAKVAYSTLQHDLLQPRSTVPNGQTRTGQVSLVV